MSLRSESSWPGEKPSFHGFPEKIMNGRIDYLERLMKHIDAAPKYNFLELILLSSMLTVQSNDQVLEALYELK